MRKTVRLNGADHEIDSEKIVKLASRLEPKPVAKYWVKIQGRRLPPKQVVSELLGIPLVDFTTMDAARILTAVGLKVYSQSDKAELVKTQSGALFEEYFRVHGLTDVESEPSIEGTSKRPDYRLRADGTEVLLEVMEFNATPDEFRGGAYNPYGPIREKIGAARRKFRDMEGHCSCLVLHNHERPLISLSWQIVMGAMLGDLGFSFPVNTTAGKGDLSKREQVTLGGGRMLRHDGDVPAVPENTTISAIIVVERYRIGEKRFRLSVHEREQELGRELGVEEYLELAEQSVGTERDLSLDRIRVRVHENPCARVPLDGRLFRGPFDERYGEIDGTGRSGRVYVGRGVAEFEEKSAAAKLLSRS